ncbi:MAG: methionine--tRNA ligase [Nanoarchaeota archaeon]
MKTKNKFYVTTAIDYPNAEPHIGHAYQKVIADVLARWHKLLRDNVWFLTGTDEHGKKIQETAEKSGKKPRQFVDELSEKFKEAWKLLDVDYSRFIRTTDKDHEKIVQGAIKKCQDNGDIYLGVYEGLYCTACEAYYTEKDLINGCCPFHKKPVEKIKEKSYFFKLSKYQKFLLELYKKHPEFVLPKERRNEIVNRVKEGVKDLSISRTSFDWGIPFPGDKEHVIYVWFDALFNYISGAGKKLEYWPADVQLLGKDNSWFHTVYWPAFLKSAGYKLPKTVFVHGFLTFNGQKISKSLGNSISPKVLVERYGVDSVRYFICRNFVLGEDGDFSEENLVERANGELANKLGNLVSRVAALIEKYGIEKTDNKLLKKLNLKIIENHMNKLEFDKALNEIFAFVDFCNEYVQSTQPWKSGDKKALYELSDSIKAIAILLWPFIPSSSDKIAKQFKFDIEYDNITKPLKAEGLKSFKKGEILFKKI